jgi:hypothetical protein
MCFPSPNQEVHISEKMMQPDGLVFWGWAETFDQSVFWGWKDAGFLIFLNSEFSVAKEFKHSDEMRSDVCLCD